MTNYGLAFMQEQGLKPYEVFAVDDALLHFDEEGELWRIDELASRETFLALLQGKRSFQKHISNPLWTPRYEEIYWYIDFYGRVIWGLYMGESDDYVLAHNRIFKTRDEAVDYQFYLNQLDEYKEPWEPNSLNNYTLVYDTNKDKITIQEVGNCRPATVYFRTQENADNFRKTVGDVRIKKYMFNVWE